MPNDHEQQFRADLTSSLANALRASPGISPALALQQITASMLANNPFLPPEGCPVNSLPPELLAYIFELGVRMDYSEDEDEEEEDVGIKELKGQSGSSEGPDAGPSESESKGFRRRNVAKGNDDDEDESDVEMDDGDEDWESDEDEDDDDDDNSEDEDDDDSERVLPFQVLVSHVCAHWRSIALSTPSLWTLLTVLEPPPFTRINAYLARSQGLPIDVHINATLPDDWDEEHHPRHPNHDSICESDLHDLHDLSTAFLTRAELMQLLDILLPAVAQWRVFELSVSIYAYMHSVLQRFAAVPEAPLLEVLQLYHYEDCEEYEKFNPPQFKESCVPFSGNAPRLQDVALWGVHLDWEGSRDFLQDLRDIELAYHAKDVRPSWTVFCEMIRRSPDVRTLTLCLSGPAAEEEWADEPPLEVLSLKDLVLCYHEPEYAITLMNHLDVPNVHSLAVDYDDADYTELVRVLATPRKGWGKSLLAGLEHFKISSMPCSEETVLVMFEQLAGLKSLNLNCSGEEELVYFDELSRPRSVLSSEGKMVPRIVCPQLDTLTTTGIDGSELKALVEMRKAAGCPLKRLFMCEEDELSHRDEKWLKGNLESLEFFEASDEEDVDVDMDDDDEASFEGFNPGYSNSLL